MARPPGDRRFLTPEEVTQIVKLRDGGMVYRKIAEVIGFGADTVKDAYKREKARLADPDNPPPAKRRINMPKLEAMLAEGATVEEIARALDFQVDSIRVAITRIQERDEPAALDEILLPDDVPAAPNKRFIASLSNFMSRERAVEAARLEARKAKLNSEEPKSAPTLSGDIRRFPVKGFRLGVSLLHVPDIGATFK